MANAPLSASDLPLKVLIWDDGKRAKESYIGPAVRSARYLLDPEVAQNIAGMDPLVDALIAP